MSYYRPITYTSTSDDAHEDPYFQQRLAFAGQTDMMELAHFTRMRQLDFTSSLMRYAHPHAGMYQDLNSAYGDDCTVPVVTQQSVFDNEEAIQSQNYRPFAYGSSELNVAPESFTSSASFETQSNLGQLVCSQPGIGISPARENTRVIHDLSTIARRSDLQWITTTSHDMRTESPLNTSSPRPQIHPIYPAHPTPPNINLNQQNIYDEGTTSSATVNPQRFTQQGYPEISKQASSSTSRTKKSSSGNPSKPKGTPGRKRKFQDHELTPEEATKRRIRRERNKVAAAKCRNRRRELTDRLQGETDHLEDHQNQLQQEILSLQQEKEHLEFILAAHAPNCKVGIASVEPSALVSENTRTTGTRIENVSFPPQLSVVDDIMSGTSGESSFYFQPHGQSSIQYSLSTSHDLNQKMNIKLENPSKVDNSVKCGNISNVSSGYLPTDLSNRPNLQSTKSPSKLSIPTMAVDPITEDTLNTPVCTLATPSYTSGIFTFPTTPNVCNTTTELIFSYTPVSAVTSSKGSVTFASPPTTIGTPTFSRNTNTPLPCSLAHRRRSSSDSLTSPDSVKSLLAL